MVILNFIKKLISKEPFYTIFCVVFGIIFVTLVGLGVGLIVYPFESVLSYLFDIFDSTFIKNILAILGFIFLVNIIYDVFKKERAKKWQEKENQKIIDKYFE